MAIPRITRFFGFLGQFAGPISPTDLLDYGNEVTGAQPSATVRAPDGLPSFAWAAHAASADGVTVALQGDADWLDSAASTASVGSILNAYRDSGARLLRSLRGRYALAIFDARLGQLILAVDPMGIERLTYAVSGRGVVFSTSAEAVARFPAVRAPLSNQALFDYLLHHVVPAPATAFEGVWKLPPATHVVIAEGLTRSDRHWTPAFNSRGGASLSALKTDLHSTLRAAVARCSPDSNTGAFLSGGLDSSTVAGLLSEVQDAPAKTFTIGFGYPDYDELPFARIANAKFGCEGHEYVIRGQDIAGTFHQIARAYDEPFGNSSALPAYHCALMARDAGVDHLLAGDGGDELFAGNSRYAEQRVFEWYHRAPSVLRERLLEPALKHWPQKEPVWPVRKARGYVEKARIPLPARLEAWNFLIHFGPDRILMPEFLATVNAFEPFTRMKEIWESTPSQSTLQRMLFYDWHYTLADNDLRKVEVMSALAGVRVSYPMLHHSVVDLSTRIPPGVMMPGRKLRDFYKRAMSGYLPDEIISKTKHGFGLPFGLWLRESRELRELIFGSLASLRGRGIVRPDFLDGLLHLHSNEDARYYGGFVWVLAMLEQWLQEHRVAP